MIPDRPTVTEVVRKLETLGSPDQIALFFKQEQVFGRPCVAFECPVANYVKRETGEMTSVSGWSVTSGDVRVEFPWESAISDFVARFDGFGYPDLIA